MTCTKIARLRSGAAVFLAASAALLAGCANGPSPLPSLTTGSLFGKSDAQAAAAAAPAPKIDPQAPLPDTPTNRAIQVGITSARATKCGFNFDAPKVKSSFMASQAQAGSPVDEMAKLEKIYQSSYNAVARAAAQREGYCNPQRVQMTKADLSQLLAGNYAPQRLHPKEEDEPGLFSFGGTSFNNPFE